MIDIEAYLRSKNIAFKRATATEIHMACWWCGEVEGKRGRLYVNIDPNQEPPGLFSCFLCGERGALRKIFKHFGDPIPKDDSDDSYAASNVLQEAVAYYHDSLGDATDALKYLRDVRGFGIDTIMERKFGWADGGLKKHLQNKGFNSADMAATGLVDAMGRDFFRDEIIIPYFVAGSAVQLRGKQIGGKYRTPPGNKARLFNTDTTWSTEEVFVTEGELDCIAMEQVGLRAVGVPGAGLWQTQWNGYFDNMKKVFVCFDPDEAGLAGAEKVMHQIGPKARLIILPVAEGENPKEIDPSYLIAKKGWDKTNFDLLVVRSKSGSLVTVHDAHLEWQEMRGVPGLKLGIPPIDNRLEPGLRPSQLMVVLAHTGSGKTLLLLNTFYRMVALQPDVKILFVSLEQTRSDWYERARRIHRFHNPNERGSNCLEYFHNNLMIVDKNRITAEELVDCITQYEYEIGKKPDLVAVDYLGYWARAYKGEPYERTSEAVMTLKAIAKEHRLAIIAPHQVNRGARAGEEIGISDGREAGTVEETADFLLGMWTPDGRRGTDLNEREGQVFIKILKSRHGGTGAKATMQFAPLSLAMVPVLDHGDPLLQRAKRDFEFMGKGENYATVMERHRMNDYTDWGVKMSDDDEED